MADILLTFTDAVTKLKKNIVSWEGTGNFLLHSNTNACNMAVSSFQIFCAVTVVAVATFINLPAPRFSQRLQEWRNMGQYFNYRGNAIFYQGELMNKLLLARNRLICIEFWIFNLKRFRNPIFVGNSEQNEVYLGTSIAEACQHRSQNLLCLNNLSCILLHTYSWFATPWQGGHVGGQ